MTGLQVAALSTGALAALAAWVAAADGEPAVPDWSDLAIQVEWQRLDGRYHVVAQVPLGYALAREVTDGTMSVLVRFRPAMLGNGPHLTQEVQSRCEDAVIDDTLLQDRDRLPPPLDHEMDCNGTRYRIMLLPRKTEL